MAGVKGYDKVTLGNGAARTGKPEPLGGNLSGWWSRRISHEHRLVYRVMGSADAQTVQVAQCRYHY
ncbi:Txe/YoeB family addiction module toxin [Sphingomonas sp. 4RDLI-65]